MKFSRPCWGLLACAFVLFGCMRPSVPRSTELRIASATVDSDAMLWQLGRATQARVVAVSALVDDPRYSPVPGVWPDSVQRVAGSSEALVALQPTVVFMAQWSDPSGRALLEQSGMNVVVLAGYGGFDDYRARLRTVSEAVDATEDGERLVNEFDEAQRAVQSNVGAGKTVVSYANGNVAGMGTTFADEAEAVGLVNIPSREGLSGHPKVDLERLVAWQPDIIVIPCDGECAETERLFAERPGISATPAAKHGLVVALDPVVLFATGPRMLDVPRALATRLSEGSQ